MRCSHRLLLYAVGSRYGVSEKPDLGWEKGKNCEQNAKDTEQGKGNFGVSTGGGFTVKLPRLPHVKQGRREEKDRNIEPIGGLCDRPVIGVKQDGNEEKSVQNAAHFDAPKLLLTKGKALPDREQKGRPEEQLHVLKGRFVDAREGGDPQGLPEPIV